MKAEYPIALLCESLGVSRSGYYAWCSRRPSERQRRDAQLSQEILSIHAASRQTYGSLRITAELQAAGQPVGRRRVMRLMRQKHLQGRRRRRWRPGTTDSGHCRPVAPNRLLGGVQPVKPNQLWVTDITCVSTVQGWLYVAAVLDRYSRRLIGWAFDQAQGTALCVRALEMAARHRRPPPGLVHHSDRGAQYASDEYQVGLERIGAVASMSRSGNCYDNAFIEAFWSTMKLECIEGRRFATREQASLALFDYIESFYNRSRRHSSLGYLSPVAFEQNQ